MDSSALLADYDYVISAECYGSHPDLVPDVDTSRQDSLTINLVYHKDRNNHIAVPGATFEIHKVANLTN